MNRACCFGRKVALKNGMDAEGNRLEYGYFIAFNYSIAAQGAVALLEDFDGNVGAFKLTEFVFTDEFKATDTFEVQELTASVPKLLAKAKKKAKAKK